MYQTIHDVNMQTLNNKRKTLRLSKPSKACVAELVCSLHVRYYVLQITEFELSSTLQTEHRIGFKIVQRHNVYLQKLTAQAIM